MAINPNLYKFLAKELGQEVFRLSSEALTKDLPAEVIGDLMWAFLGDFVTKNVDPDKLFSTPQLEKWAREHGFVPGTYMVDASTERAKKMREAQQAQAVRGKKLSEERKAGRKAS